MKTRLFVFVCFIRSYFVCCSMFDVLLDASVLDVSNNKCYSNMGRSFRIFVPQHLFERVSNVIGSFLDCL